MNLQGLLNKLNELAHPLMPSALIRCLSTGALISFTLYSSLGNARVLDRIVAIVNREVITLSELQEKLRPLQRQLNTIGDPLRREQLRREQERSALDGLIGELLVLQAHL